MEAFKEPYGQEIILNAHKYALSCTDKTVLRTCKWVLKWRNDLPTITKVVMLCETIKFIDDNPSDPSDNPQKEVALDEWKKFARTIWNGLEDDIRVVVKHRLANKDDTEGYINELRTKHI